MAMFYLKRGGGEDANSRAEQIPSIELGPNRSRVESPSNAGLTSEDPAFAGLAKGFTDLTEAVQKLRSEVASLQADIPWSQRLRPDEHGVPLTVQAASNPLTATTSEFESQFDEEQGQSAWGREVAAGIDSAFSNKRSTSPVFREYGGDLSSACKRTLCKVSWSSEQLAGLGEADRADALEAARWEVMAVVAQSGVTGQFSVSLDEREGVPTMTVLVKQDAGGDVPDAPMKP
jgi:hypothetical protein